MKKRILLLLAAIAAIGAFAQKAATSPRRLVVDVSYRVNTDTAKKINTSLYSLQSFNYN